MPTAVITQNTTPANGSFDDQYTGLVANLIDANDPTSNGKGGRGRLYDFGGYSRRHFYQATGLSNITGPVTVSAASFFVYVYAQASTDDVTLTAARVIPAAVDAQITWNVYSTGNAWDSGGASTSGTDYDAAVATGNSGTGAAGYWIEVTGVNLAAMVEDWINGTESNYGFRLNSNNSAYKEIITGATGGYDGTRPELFVTWATAGGDPEGRLIGGKLIRGGLLRSGVL